MCGIFGLFGEFPEEVRDVATMAAERGLRHRGPDSGGCVVRGSGLLVARRLAVVDVSTHGSQPLSVGDDGCWLAYNGMLYNHRELREELRHAHRFRSTGDTEVVAAALTTWGAEALRRFEGMFALLWWDSRRSELLAAVDHLSIKPLLWYQDSRGRIACSSELGPLVDVFPEIRVDPDSLGTYLSTGLIDHSPRTLLRDVRQLRHGQLLKWSPRGVSVRRYRDLLPAKTASLAPLETRQGDNHHRDLMSRSVERHVVSDVPVGLALSSGVDSNLLLQVANASVGADRIRTFTHCFTGTDYDEGKRLESFSTANSAQSTRIEIDVEMLRERMPSQIERTLEPIGGLGVFAASQTYRVASEFGIRVMLTGEGADELFGGYSYYRESAAQATLAEHAPARYMVRAPDGTALDGPPLTGMFAFEVVPPDFGSAIEQSVGRSPLRRAMWADLVALKLPKLLRFQDRMSMLSSVEARAPFLDLPLVLHSLSLPDEDLVSAGQTKPMLRRLLSGLAGSRIPPEKFHVSAPQREWVKGSLGVWITDLASESRLSADGIIDGPAFMNRLRAYRDSRKLDNSFFAWQFMSLELWYRAVATRGAQARRRRPR